MAGALNPDLFDFIESLEREEKYSSTTATAAPNNINIDDTISDSSSIISNRDSQTVDVWQDIATALNNWTQRILDVESRCNNKAASFRQTIEGYNSWTGLSITSTYANYDILQISGRVYCNTVRRVSVKRDIITYLLELHTLRQINGNLFIETCLK